MYERLFGRTSGVVALLVLLAAFVHPPGGLGRPVCWLKAATGLPCPGCGLSRSLSCTVRGDLPAACTQHPFGPVLIPLLAGIVIVRLLPRTPRERVRRWTLRHEPWLRAAYGLLIGGFLVFGMWRAVAALC